MDYPNCIKNGCPITDSQGRQCRGCGFDRDEVMRRKQLLKTYGLARSRKTGRRRLLLRRGSSKRRERSDAK